MKWPTLATSRLRERDARQAERADVSKSNQQKPEMGLGLSRNGREISLLRGWTPERSLPAKTLLSVACENIRFSSARNVLSDEERGETDVFACYVECAPLPFPSG